MADFDLSGLPVEFLSHPDFEKALLLALGILNGDQMVLGIKTWADAEVTKAGS